MTIIITLLIINLLVLLWLYRQQSLKQKDSTVLQQLHDQLSKEFADSRLQQEQRFHTFRDQVKEDLHKLDKTLQTDIHKFGTHFDERQIKAMQTLQDSLRKNMAQISDKVDERLAGGFKKTTETFTDVVKRLTIIDQAQKEINRLSSNVVGLQEVLSNKHSRGAFGEVQLATLIRNVMPAQSFALQYELSNKKRADCVLFLPSPTGNMVIDAKFPLENYRQAMNANLTEDERKHHERLFKVDIKKHIQDIAEKYIIPKETADGAMMFIPAEAVFAEIHAHHPDLVELAQKARVWLVSPTTMMAVLTTARAVLKDTATRHQVHLIQEHLIKLGKDFGRFEGRMQNLSRHIRQAHDDVGEVNKSAEKLVKRFEKIEQVELEEQKKIELL
ncbi:MAG: DNA recombination protein RmuC [Pseudomonadota bacterium]